MIRGGPLRVSGLRPSRLVRGPDGWSLGSAVGPAAGDVLICRCGRSATMPLCDGAPSFACFEEAPSTGRIVKPFTWDVPDPTVPAVALKPNGPARVGGGVPVCDQVGAILDPGERTSLCRCGASGAQPLCDGSHKIAPFDDP